MLRLSYWLALLLIIALALALRLPNLAHRPLHNDEGVNAAKFNELWTTGKVKYDPVEYHGPTLWYLTLPVIWASGAKDFAATTVEMYRLVPLIFGVGLILLLPLVSDGLGRIGVLFAALFTAVSPAFVFYSRYYIHEMPLVFFAFASIACGWRYRRSNHLAWAAACGAFIGLTYTTKETWVLALAAAAASAVTAATIWRFLIKGIPHHLHFRKRAVAIGFAAFVIVFFLFFSGFFTQMSAPVDALMAYVHYTGRASGSVHDEPWNYYLKLLLYWKIKPGPVWTEASIVALALIGFLLAVLRKHIIHPAHASSAHPVSTNSEQPTTTDPKPIFPSFPPFVRFIGFYTLFLLIAFSIIPYKTPWCLLGFLNGMILLAGFASGQILHLAPGLITKSAAALILLAAASHLAWQADRATNNFADTKHPAYFEASRYNPYVYAQTSTDIFNLVKRLDAIASVSPQGHKISIDVIAHDYWPLPFYLRHFGNISYPTDPEKYRNADVIIGTAEDGDRLSGDLAKIKYVPSQFGLRPQVLLWVYVRQDLWEKLQAKWRLPAP